MPLKTTSLTLAALVCLAAAYRFGSHGIRLKDNLCIGLACLASGVAVFLLWCAFRPSRHQRD